MSETLRVRGDKLDESDYCIDVVVTDVTLDGIIHLEENVSSSPRSWTMKMDEWEDLKDNNYAAKLSDLSDPNHSIWTTLKELYNSSDDSAVSSVSATIETNALDLFRIVMRAMQ